MHVLAFFFVSILGMKQRNLIKSVIMINSGIANGFEKKPEPE
jgi:hypothetical protein